MANKRLDKRKQTQMQQAAAKPKLHPRGLARSAAKGRPGGQLPNRWRNIVAAMPRIGRKYLRRLEKEAARRVEMNRSKTVAEG